MGNLSMFVVLGLAISFGIVGYNLSHVSTESVENAATYYGSLAAKNLSRSALNYYLYKIKKNPPLTGTFSDANGYYDGGSVTVTITDLGGDDRQVDVNSDFYGNTHTASAKITVTQAESGGCELGYAVFAGHDIAFQDDGVVNGDVYAEHSSHSSASWVITGSEVESPPTLTRPTVDLSVFESAAIADGQYYTSNISFTSAGSPYSGVWYTTGTATINASAVVNGTIVAESNIDISGDNITLTALPANWPILVSNGNITGTSNNMTATGFIFTDYNFTVNGDDIVFTGAIVVKGHDARGSGNNKTITYDADYATDIMGVTFPGCSGKNLLFVVGDKVTLDPQDQLKYDAIESWGYEIALVEDNDAQATIDAALDTCGVVYISETILSGLVGTKLTATTLGVVNEEIALLDELGITSSGAWETTAAFTISDDSHYITSSLGTGSHTVASSAQPLNTLSGTQAPDLRVLGSLSGTDALGVLETGDALYGGGTAAGRRVALLMGRSASNPDFNALTTDGLTLVKRSIQWAASDTTTGGGGGGRTSVTVNSLYE